MLGGKSPDFQGKTFHLLLVWFAFLLSAERKVTFISVCCHYQSYALWFIRFISYYHCSIFTTFIVSVIVIVAGLCQSTCYCWRSPLQGWDHLPPQPAGNTYLDSPAVCNLNAIVSESESDDNVEIKLPGDQFCQFHNWSWKKKWK